MKVPILGTARAGEMSLELLEASVVAATKKVRSKKYWTKIPLNCPVPIAPKSNYIIRHQSPRPSLIRFIPHVRRIQGENKACIDRPE